MPPEDSEQIRRICERTGMKQKSAHGAQNNPSRRNGTPPKLKGAQSLHIISNNPKEQKKAPKVYKALGKGVRGETFFSKKVSPGKANASQYY